MLRTDLDVLLKESYERATQLPAFAHASHRTIALLEYHLNQSVDLFRAHLGMSLRLRLERYTSPGRWSEQPILRYQEALDALAVGDFALARDFSNLIQPCRAARFDKALATVVKAAVISEPIAFALALALLRKVAEKERKLVGIHAFLSALANRDRLAAQSAVTQMVDDQSKRMNRGIFNTRVDKFLYVWGIGLGNIGDILLY